ncbi:MAG: Maf family protein [Phycisphaerae bacterium]
MAKPNKFILASASPRRAELLHAAGLDFHVRVSPTPEPTRRPNWIPITTWPALLALIKAQSVLALYPGQPVVVIGADTIVELDGEILGKPRHCSDARRMLTRLSGHQHQVHTGVAIVTPHGQETLLATSVCYLKKLTPRQLKAYLDSGLWHGKAGAYGIQDETTEPWVRLRRGSWSNVVGLPMEALRPRLQTYANAGC